MVKVRDSGRITVLGCVVRIVTLVAIRGAAILREIGGADGADIAWLAARWSDRWAGDAAAVARR